MDCVVIEFVKALLCQSQRKASDSFTLLSGDMNPSCPTLTFLWYQARQGIVCSLLWSLSPQGSYWAIDTNPKEDALPTRPKKRPRSGERVSPPDTPHPPWIFVFYTCRYPLLNNAIASNNECAHVENWVTISYKVFTYRYSLFNLLPIDLCLSLLYTVSLTCTQ